MTQPRTANGHSGPHGRVADLDQLGESPARAELVQVDPSALCAGEPAALASWSTGLTDGHPTDDLPAAMLGRLRRDLVAAVAGLVSVAASPVEVSHVLAQIFGEALAVAPTLAKWAPDVLAFLIAAHEHQKLPDELDDGAPLAKHPRLVEIVAALSDAEYTLFRRLADAGVSAALFR